MQQALSVHGDIQMRAGHDQAGDLASGIFPANSPEDLSRLVVVQDHPVAGIAYKDIVAFLFLVLFLIFRPMGLLGKKEGEKA